MNFFSSIKDKFLNVNNSKTFKHISQAKIKEKDSGKTQYIKNVFSNGNLPTNFSVNLGVAPCNHSCLFCPQSIEKPKKMKLLDRNLLKKVLHEMPKNEILLNISSYFETITSPNLIDSVQLMKKIRPNLPIALASNGTIYRKQVIEELIDNGLDHFSFSFDAATREDYKILMQKDHFERAWENLNKLVEIRDKKNSKMKITTHVMGFKGKENDFEKFKSYWEKKVDAVIWRRVANWGDDKLGLENQLKENGFESDYKTPEQRSPCTSIFMHFKIGYEGDYWPCVSAIPAYDKHLVPPIGNAWEITWLDAWQKLSEMRNDHLNCNWNKYDCCKTCNVWSMWDPMWSWDKKTNKFTIKDAIYVDK